MNGIIKLNRTSTPSHIYEIIELSHRLIAMRSLDCYSYYFCHALMLINWLFVRNTIITSTRTIRAGDHSFPVRLISQYLQSADEIAVQFVSHPVEQIALRIKFRMRKVVIIS